ncbi:LysR family transcriptional regulator [Roseibium suaedae]|uniref:DNA-binding transcriptional regulator, LysR family n=1 Tax=Roseibium suaedae TaxID=735517 RepID=A0A1M7GZ34_9HYPH|nr:LysR family transcriptional regulator [Roseibium suaedae]SHM21129.1 DNA-binding transcriptional regulator, LysR family [Roseibium suaedae]
MELRHIRYFLAVAEEQSFTRAAERLGIGQPPLSQQIKALEEEVGTRLFRRLSHGTELTAAGLAFQEKVAALPDIAVQAALLARKVAAGQSGTLRMGLTGTAALNPVIPACIRAYRAAYPDVDIEITEGNSVVLASALSEGKLDTAILRPSRFDPEELAEETLIEEGLFAALPEHHPLAETGGVIDLALLRDDAFILTPRDAGMSLHDAILKTCVEAGFNPKLGPPAPQIASILSLVAADLGVSLVPASMARLNVHGVALRPLKDAHDPVSLAVAWRRSPIAALPQNFVRIARATAASLTTSLE